MVDTGIGIAREHHERIFEEFYQVRATTSSRAQSGMGLGLAIVRRLAALLGHRIEVASRVGRGSRFRVHASQACPASRRASPALPHCTAKSRDGAAAIAGSLVAVVDDDPAAVDAMTVLFETWGARVAGGRDADTLLDALGDADGYPDLVVADLRLGHGDSGIDVVRKIRNELGVTVPALLVSGDLGPAAERDARAAGLVLLDKPVVPAVLQATATALIAGG